MPVVDPLYAALLTTPQDRAEQALALRYAPIIHFDSHEPFLPLAVGYTIFRADAPSPSFARQITLAAAGRPSATVVLEYAIWWDRTLVTCTNWSMCGSMWTPLGRWCIVRLARTVAITPCW